MLCDDIVLITLNFVSEYKNIKFILNNCNCPFLFLGSRVGVAGLLQIKINVIPLSFIQLQIIEFYSLGTLL